jgi:hypothetical protein
LDKFKKILKSADFISVGNPEDGEYIGPIKYKP